MTQYVQKQTLTIMSQLKLVRTKPGLVVKRRGEPLTPYDLDLLGGAELDESAPVGYRATGYAVVVDGVYYREYIDQTPAEAAAERQGELDATDGDSPHVLEMLIITLIQKGVIAATDLPQDVRDKLAARKAKREAL